MVGRLLRSGVREDLPDLGGDLYVIVENVVVVDIYLLVYKTKKCPPAMGGRDDCSVSPAYGRAKPLQP